MWTSSRSPCPVFSPTGTSCQKTWWEGLILVGQHPPGEGHDGYAVKPVWLAPDGMMRARALSRGDPSTGTRQIGSPAAVGWHRELIQGDICNNNLSSTCMWQQELTWAWQVQGAWRKELQELRCVIKAMSNAQFGNVFRHLLQLHLLLTVTRAFFQPLQGLPWLPDQRPRGLDLLLELHAPASLGSSGHTSSEQPAWSGPSFPTSWTGKNGPKLRA